MAPRVSKPQADFKSAEYVDDSDSDEHIAPAPEANNTANPKRKSGRGATSKKGLANGASSGLGKIKDHRRQSTRSTESESRSTQDTPNTSRSAGQESGSGDAETTSGSKQDSPLQGNSRSATQKRQLPVGRVQNAKTPSQATTQDGTDDEEDARESEDEGVANGRENTQGSEAASDNLAAVSPSSTALIHTTTNTTPLPPFSPPSQFEAATIPTSFNVRVETDFAASNLEGKQIWHIRAPTSLPLSSMRQIAAQCVTDGSSILSHEGNEYGLVPAPGVDQAASETVLVPSSQANQYQQVPVAITSTLNLQRLITLPTHALDQSRSDDGNSALPRKTKKPRNEQPEGLKMRSHAFGIPAAGGSDSASDADRPTTQRPQFKVPESMEQSSNTKQKRRHAQNDATVVDGQRVVPAKKKRKTRAPETGKETPAKSTIPVLDVDNDEDFKRHRANGMWKPSSPEKLASKHDHTYQEAQDPQKTLRQPFSVPRSKSSTRQDRAKDVGSKNMSVGLNDMEIDEDNDVQIDGDIDAGFNSRGPQQTPIKSSKINGVSPPSSPKPSLPPNPADFQDDSQVDAAEERRKRKEEKWKRREGKRKRKEAEVVEDSIGVKDAGLEDVAQASTLENNAFASQAPAEEGDPMEVDAMPQSPPLPDNFPPIPDAAETPVAAPLDERSQRKEQKRLRKEEKGRLKEAQRTEQAGTAEQRVQLNGLAQADEPNVAVTDEPTSTVNGVAMEAAVEPVKKNKKKKKHELAQSPEIPEPVAASSKPSSSPLPESNRHHQDLVKGTKATKEASSSPQKQRSLPEPDANSPDATLGTTSSKKKKRRSDIQGQSKSSRSEPNAGGRAQSPALPSENSVAENEAAANALEFKQASYQKPRLGSPIALKANAPAIPSLEAETPKAEPRKKAKQREKDTAKTGESISNKQKSTTSGPAVSDPDEPSLAKPASEDKSSAKAASPEKVSKRKAKQQKKVEKEAAETAQTQPTIEEAENPSARKSILPGTITEADLEALKEKIRKQRAEEAEKAKREAAQQRLTVNCAANPTPPKPASPVPPSTAVKETTIELEKKSSNKKTKASKEATTTNRTTQEKPQAKGTSTPVPPKATSPVLPATTGTAPQPAVTEAASKPKRKRKTKAQREAEEAEAEAARQAAAANTAYTPLPPRLDFSKLFSSNKQATPTAPATEGKPKAKRARKA